MASRRATPDRAGARPYRPIKRSEFTAERRTSNPSRERLLVDAPQKKGRTHAGNHRADAEEKQITGDGAYMCTMKIHIPKCPTKMGEREKLGAHADRSRQLVQWSKRA